ncbi:VanZ family protein [Luteitalea sp.]|uniref:VanZ family protein n=1 Tax=Luteitalea sp. TaxID=2004800 RepID=UPI0037C6A5DC
MPLPPLADRSSRGRLLTLLLYAAFIGYQSLAAGGTWHCGGDVLEVPRRIARGDLLVNIVAYVPLGALCVAAAWPVNRRVSTIVLVVVGSAMLVSLYSLGMELVQACEPKRVSSAIDWAANSAGGAAGAIGCAFVLMLRLPRGLPALTLDDPRLRACTLAVALLWIASETMPWLFSLDLGQARSHLRFLVRSDPLADLDPWRIARHAGAWLAIAAACRLVVRSTPAALACIGLMAAASLGLQVIAFARVPLSFAELFGMAAALGPAALGILLLRERHALRAWPVALLAGVIVVLVAYQLHPEVEKNAGRSFGWWPRVGFGSPIGALDFAWLFGWVGLSTVAAAEWARRAMVPAWPQAWPAAIVALVFLLELAQAFVPGRSGDTSAVLFTGLAVIATRAALREIE